jgi:hypothetical protein
MTSYILYEDDYNQLYNIEVYQVGDIIEYIPNNQLGYLKYRVVLKNNEKTLEILEDIYGKV